MSLDRVFVTGGSGFVGRNLIRALCARGVKVMALARSESAEQVVQACGANPVHGSLADQDQMAEAMLGCDCVFHAAALVSEWGDPDDYARANIAGTEQVLAAAQRAGVPRFVHIGTEAVFADGHSALKGLTEKSPKPVDPLPRYPQSKSISEDLVLAARSDRFATMVVRPRLIWGNDDTSVLPQIEQAVSDGRFMWIDGGHALTSTCHVDNVVEGAILAAEKGTGGGVYFLTDGEPVTVRDFLTRMLATRGVTPPDKSVPLWLARLSARVSEWVWETFGLKGAPPATRVAVELIGQEVTVSDARARQELGYRPKLGIEDGLASICIPDDLAG